MPQIHSYQGRTDDPAVLMIVPFADHHAGWSWPVYVTSAAAAATQQLSQLSQHHRM